VTFTAPAGIGASRDVSVEIIDAAVAEGRTTTAAVGFSGVQRSTARGAFSYDAPTIDRTDPTRVYLESQGSLEDYRGALLAVADRMSNLQELNPGSPEVALLENAQLPLSEFINSGSSGWGSQLSALRASAQNAQAREDLQGPTKRVFLFGRNYGNPVQAVQ